MNLNQFLAILKARWPIAVAVFALTVLTTLAVSLMLPKRYSATSTLVVDVKSPDPIAGMMLPALALPSYMATQVDVIQSDRVAQRVVKVLRLAENPEVRKQWMESTEGKGSLEAWLAKTFQKQLDVKPSRESNVITVTYTAPDPRFAKAVADGFVQAFLDVTVDLRVDPARQYSSFFEQRAKQLRDAVEKAQAKLSTFQQENGLVAADERLDVETARLNELSSQLVMLQAASAESAGRSAQAAGASGGSMQEVLNNPVVATLKTDLSRNEAQLQQLSARLGSNHPQVIEAKANIAELRARMDSEVRRVTGSLALNNQVNRSREGEVRAALDAQRSKVLKLKALRDEATVLQRDVENAQRAYDAVVARGSQTSLESQTTQSNISVLSPAVEPSEPSSPKIALNTFLSIVMGSLLAIGAAVVMELLDRRVRTVTDASEALGLPLLGTLPPPTSRRRRLAAAGKGMPLLQQRILGQLPTPSKGV
ncbi:chain length determinant protein EpsF [Ideonella sp. BN130291]|uniref:chain length determinant protein EpsF n=1 Tax=Ideonella sp. BN130291 TaxID=3112940 RepID=UPI002E25790E|nr:chain length determinant protein EpsF [Ideonella sp. BN130291]